MSATLRGILAAVIAAATMASACGDDPPNPNPVGPTPNPQPTNPTVTITLQSLTVTPSTVQSPTQPTGQVTLSAAATSGAVVSLQSGNTAVARVPASVTVPSGGTTATFAVETLTVTSTTNVSITATYSGVSRSATLAVTAPPPPPNPNPTPNPSRTFWMGLSGNQVGCTGGFADIVLMENNIGQQGTLTLCNQDTLQPLAWMSSAPISIGAPNAINQREVVFDVYLANLTTQCKFHPNFTFYVQTTPYAFLFNFPPDILPFDPVWHGTRTLFIQNNGRVTARPSGDSYIHSCQ